MHHLPTVPTDADAVPAHRALAPDPAPVPRPVQEGEPAARVAAHAERVIERPQLEERREQPVHEAGPARALRPDPVGRQPEGDAGQGRVQLGSVGRAPAGHRRIACEPADELTHRSEPVERVPIGESVGHGDRVVGQERPRLGRITQVVVIGAVDDDPDPLVATGTMARVRDDEKVVGWRARCRRNMHRCR